MRWCPGPTTPSPVLADGDAVEIVTLVGGGQELDGPLTVGPFTFRSRLFTGTGKYASPRSDAGSAWPPAVAK